MEKEPLQMNYLPHVQHKDSIAEETYSHPLVGDLRVVFKADDGLGPLTHIQFESLGISAQDLLSGSLDTLEQRLTRLTGQQVSGLKFGLEDERPVFTSLKVGHGLEASLLLLPHVWDQFATQISGELVVGVPGADRLIFASSDHFEGQLAMRRLLEAAFEGPHPLSRDLLVWRQSQWQVYAE